MGSESKDRNGDGGGRGAAQWIPATEKKVVQSLREIVNCTEQEIYAVLMECDMDPNRAVERLLTQDTFHEVRSKRERRKEMKEAFDSRSSGNNHVIRGGKTNSDRKVGRSGLTHMTYNELGKAADKGEVGSVCQSSTTHVVRKSTNSDSFSTDNGSQTSRTGDSISVSAKVSPGFQPSCLGVSKGHLSMADIVRMGRPSQEAVSHNHSNASGVSESGNSESSLSLYCQNHSELQVSYDEWGVIEPPITGNSQLSNISASSNANGPPEHPSLHDNAVSLCKSSNSDEAQISLGNVASDNVISEKIETASSTCSKQTIMSYKGLGPHSGHCLKNVVSSDFDSSYEHHRDVSSAASDFQQLSIRESEVPSSENNCTVVLPNHLQALAAECSHLSFGTYNGGNNSASSAILAPNLSRSGLEEKAATVDGSSVHFLDPSSVFRDDKQPVFDVLRGTAADKNCDFLSSSYLKLMKHIAPEPILGHEYNTIASVSDPSFQKSHSVVPPSFKRTGLQGGNISTFPRETLADSSSVPEDVLAFLMSQSQALGYSNALSSISNPAFSMSEVMKPGAAPLPHRPLTQDLTVQSSIHFEQLPDPKSYSSLPQNQSYITAINSQQAFSGSAAYNQSPVDMKYNIPQNRNEFLLSGLPPATVRDGHGNLGSSSYTGSSLSNPSPGYMMPSINFDENLPSQYNGGRSLSSMQQHPSLSQWNYGAQSRSSFLQEGMQYNFLGQPSQSPHSQFVNPGYSDLYHSQTRVVEELQQPGTSQDLSTKQSHQFWQHIH